MINTRLSKVGLSRQSAGEGTPIASPATFGFGLLDGRVIELPIEQSAEEVTSDSRVNPGHNRTSAIPGAAFGTRLYPRMAGLLLYAALGAVATSGPVGGVYTHVITEADDVPWLTLHGKMGGEYYRLQDAKLDELTLSWDGPGPLKAAAKLIGENLDFPAAWTATNSEADNAGGKFRGAGGSFKADVDSAVPVTAPVKAGEVKFTNGLSAEILSDSIRPQEIFPTVLVPSVSLTLKPDDLLRWREAVTGSAAGTAIQDTPVYGSFEVKFVIDANTDLVIAATRVPFLAEFPEANPSGEPAELVLVGEADKPSAGAAITATLRNAQASY